MSNTDIIRKDIFLFINDDLSISLMLDEDIPIYRYYFGYCKPDIAMDVCFVVKLKFNNNIPCLIIKNCSNYEFDIERNMEIFSEILTDNEELKVRGCISISNDKNDGFILKTLKDTVFIRHIDKKMNLFELAENEKMYLRMDYKTIKIYLKTNKNDDLQIWEEW